MPAKRPPSFSHIAADGTVRMVDISAKPVSRRIATAESVIQLSAETLTRIEANAIAKGNVLATARIAAISALKRTDSLIPLCHSLPIQHAEVDFEREAAGIKIRCSVTTSAQTGVEMEALTGATIAALTIYDMCKAVDKTMIIREIRLVSKTKRRQEIA
jgi:cyclic pyranopterin monophosphate synthase